MASVMALLSKTEFEKLASGSSRDFGGVCHRLDRYVSSNRALETLREGGSLFLVTVRPPNDKLLLVAILEKPEHDGTAWVSAKKNVVTSVPIGSVRDRLKLETGKGLDAKPGALAMSLQTPRRLTDDDVQLLREAATGKAVTAAKETRRPPTKPAAKDAKKDAKRNARNDAKKDAKNDARNDAKKGRVTGEIATLIESAFQQIEDDYLDAIRRKPDAVLAARDFAKTIQSIFSGSFDTPKETLPLLEELAPFADGRVITRRLAGSLRKGADATELSNELVDAYAVSAINVFGTAIVALALGRPGDVPAAALPFRTQLAVRAASLKTLLADDS